MIARLQAIRGSIAALVAVAAAVLVLVPAIAQAQPSGGGGGGGKVTCEAPGGGQVEAGDEVTIIIRNTRTGKIVAKHEYICGNDGKMHTIGLKGRPPATRGGTVSTTVIVAHR